MTIIIALFSIPLYRHLSFSIENSRNITQSLNYLDQLQAVIKIISANKSPDKAVPGNLSSNTYKEAHRKLLTLMRPDSFYKMQPEHAKRLIELNNLIQQQLNALEEKENAVDALPHQMTEIDWLRDENIRLQADKIYSSEIEKLLLLNTLQADNYKSTVKLVILSLLTCLVIIILFYLLMLRNLAIRKQAEHQLLAAKNLAENASDTKTRFLTSMSQEIRNPMNGIIGMSSLLMQTPLSNDQRKYATNIHRSSVGLLAVVNDVIDYSKIESGELKLENSPFILKHCIDEVFSITGWGIKDIKMTYHIDERIPSLITGDTTRLRQILINLIGNTVKFTEKGHIDLAVSLVKEVDDFLTLEFQIEDLGKGWWPQTAAALPFPFSPDDSIAQGESGLGLSIATRMIALMGGGVKYESFADKGNIFTFSIIVRKVTGDVAVAPQSNAVLSLPDSELSKRNPLKIMVVDDHEMNQILLSSILMMMGYACTTARNGSEAVARAIEENYDLIFMDIYMPVMDGLEATQAIRHYYLKADKPVIIAITANALIEEKDNCMKAGMNDLITKPYQPADIQRKIEQWGQIVHQGLPA